MIRVKLTTDIPQSPVIRQTPGSRGVWGNCQFYIDDDAKECDWWVVLDGLSEKQTANCYPGNTILATGEPPSIKKYENKFVRQFDTVITTQTNIKGPNIINLQLLPWYIGSHFSVSQNKFDKYTKSYDELKRVSNIQKTRLISIISSNKTSTKGQRDRLEFIKIIKEHFGDRIDAFGSGTNIIGDKWDGIAPYKYHIAIENSIHKDYWSEKLADSFLSESYTFYHGCPNIHDYFPSHSFSAIDIYKPDEAIEIIEKAIREGYYEKYGKQIKEAKKLVLDRYQIFPQLCRIINNMPKTIENVLKQTITIAPEKKKKKNIFRRIASRIKRTMGAYRTIEPEPAEIEVIKQLPGFLDIENYMLFKLLSRISDHKTEPILEIGVFCGRSLLALAYAFPKNKVVGVDPFYESFLHSPAHEEEGVFLRKKSGEQTREERINNFKNISSINGMGANIELRLITQDEFLNRDMNEKFQLVHIDGEHTFNAVKDFFDRADKVLADNALIIVDDFLNAGFPGISEAVHTHPIYKKNVFPILYSFNKAVFIYRPSTQKNIDNLISQITSNYSDKNQYITVVDANDSSLMVQKK